MLDRDQWKWLRCRLVNSKCVRSAMPWKMCLAYRSAFVVTLKIFGAKWKPSIFIILLHSMVFNAQTMRKHLLFATHIQIHNVTTTERHFELIQFILSFLNTISLTLLLAIGSKLERHRANTKSFRIFISMFFFYLRVYFVGLYLRQTFALTFLFVYVSAHSAHSINASSHSEKVIAVRTHTHTFVHWTKSSSFKLCVQHTKKTSSRRMEYGLCVGGICFLT